MALALRMGRTLGELRQTTDGWRGFRMWAEYDRIQPNRRYSRRYSQCSAGICAVYGAQGGKVTIEDAQLQWSTEGMR
ncbi:phage tail protein [Klebsiella pneumoniae subsp. pneumoniae]|nr:phage tail protein [Klebsiella pneumoniae subsp. pneumoniae]